MLLESVLKFELEVGNHPLATLELFETTLRAERRASLLSGSARSAGALPAKSAAVKRERRRQASSGSEEEEEEGAFPFPSPSATSTKKGEKASRSSLSRADWGEEEEAAEKEEVEAATASSGGQVRREERRRGSRGRWGRDDEGDDGDGIDDFAPALAVFNAAPREERIR